MPFLTPVAVVGTSLSRNTCHCSPPKGLHTLSSTPKCQPSLLAFFLSVCSVFGMISGMFVHYTLNLPSTISSGVHPPVFPLPLPACWTLKPVTSLPHPQVHALGLFPFLLSLSLLVHPTSLWDSSSKMHPRPLACPRNLCHLPFPSPSACPA